MLQSSSFTLMKAEYYDGAADAKGSCLLVLTSPSAGQSMTREAVKWRPIAAESIFEFGTLKHRYDVHVVLNCVYTNSQLVCIRQQEANPFY